MDNPPKLATYVLDTAMRKQTHITQIRHEPPPQTTGGKDESNIVFMRKQHRVFVTIRNE